MIKLIHYISTGLSGLITIFLAQLTRKFGVAVASVAATALLTYTFVTCIGILVGQLTTSTTPPESLQYMYWFVPDNFVTILSFIIAINTCRAAYDLLIKKIELINNAS